MSDDHAIYDAWGTSENFLSGYYIGIDLGTTNSCVAVWKEMENRVKVLKNAYGSKTTPSVVQFNATNNHIVVGKDALDNIELNPESTIVCVKRLIGKLYNHDTVQQDKKYFSFNIISGSNGKACIDLNGVQKTPEEISSIILLNLKETAENYYQEKVYNAVITVPAYFNDAQRKSTILAGEIAGFRSIRLLNEPTAAAMSYGLFVAGSKLVVVIDFGGGTLDISLMEINEGKFKVIGIGGDTHLGGEDINNKLYEYILDIIKKKLNIFTPLSVKEKTTLRKAIEEAKIALSSLKSTVIQLEDFNGLENFSYILTREKFDSLCSDIYLKCINMITQVLLDSNTSSDTVNEVVLVGGSTKIPKFRDLIKEFFHDKELCILDPELTVAQGAAIQSAVLSGMDQGVLKDLLMMDILPLSIGLEKADKSFEIILPRNSSLPVTMTKYFSTYEDMQEGITVEVYEGEDKIAINNQHIGYFNFIIAKEKRGLKGEFLHPVTFTMNANGILQVQAGIHNDKQKETLSTKAFSILLFYCLVLCIFYITMRIYFADSRTTLNSSIEIQTNNNKQ